MLMSFSSLLLLLLLSGTRWVVYNICFSVRVSLSFYI